MERDDEHKKWVWKREPGPERREKDEDDRATARESVEAEDDELADEVSPLVSLWRSALAAMHDASVRADALKEHEIEEIESASMSWGNPRVDDGELN